MLGLVILKGVITQFVQQRVVCYSITNKESFLFSFLLMSEVFTVQCTDVWSQVC